MKKLLLGIGASLLAILPIAAVVSCSSSTPIETEAAKFKSAETINNGVTADEAAKAITTASTPEAKKTELAKYYKAPELSTGFTFDVKDAKVNSKTSTTLDVTVTIEETEVEANTKDITFEITKFMSAVEFEAAKFKEAVTKDATITATVAAKAINDASTQEAKKTELAKYFTIPALSDGFTYEIMKVEASGTKIDVEIKVSQTTPSENATVKFSVTGFTA
ncbi:MAG: hypothetical protein ACRC1F_02375 [Metamycoplasmataceae bacterium]